MNPMQFFQMIKGGQINPQTLAMNMLQQNMGNTPVGQNLMQLAQKNDVRGIEQVVRNILQQQGVNYDQAFNSFRQNFGI